MNRLEEKSRRGVMVRHPGGNRRGAGQLVAQGTSRGHPRVWRLAENVRAQLVT
ncbi:hypothetical protein [Rhizobium leguminosarum]|uniref:hypothetical protein n=1 Tax=Rhizobium leguminosarum TaxID=384 RepID=UPI0013F1455C|nr:hypothetical protein [Rhizobium leguminosarum]